MTKNIPDMNLIENKNPQLDSGLTNSKEFADIDDIELRENQHHDAWS
jgi:hypothetical protein